MLPEVEYWISRSDADRGCGVFCKVYVRLSRRITVRPIYVGQKIVRGSLVRVVYPRLQCMAALNERPVILELVAVHDSALREVGGWTKGEIPAPDRYICQRS